MVHLQQTKFGFINYMSNLMLSNETYTNIQILYLMHNHIFQKNQSDPHITNSKAKNDIN